MGTRATCVHSRESHKQSLVTFLLCLRHSPSRAAQQFERSQHIFLGRVAAATALYSTFPFLPLGGDQVFDVQWCKRAGSINVSGLRAPYDKNFQSTYLGDGEYFHFWKHDSGGRDAPASLALRIHHADGRIKSTVHDQGTFTLLKDAKTKAIHYNGSNRYGIIVVERQGALSASARKRYHGRSGGDRFPVAPFEVRLLDPAILC